ncbi:hypothetical protein BC828DRAFT_405102 [Blastocladiella britannica]|nr:hypothetical protein BC828DRAFT_405102 [Blastocladiella britannica]
MALEIRPVRVGLIVDMEKSLAYELDSSRRALLQRPKRGSDDKSKFKKLFFDHVQTLTDPAELVAQACELNEQLFSVLEGHSVAVLTLNTRDPATQANAVISMALHGLAQVLASQDPATCDLRLSRTLLGVTDAHCVNLLRDDQRSVPMTDDADIFDDRIDTLYENATSMDDIAADLRLAHALPYACLIRIDGSLRGRELAATVLLADLGWDSVLPEYPTLPAAGALAQSLTRLGDIAHMLYQMPVDQRIDPEGLPLLRLVLPFIAGPARALAVLQVELDAPSTPVLLKLAEALRRLKNIVRRGRPGGASRARVADLEALAADATAAKESAEYVHLTTVRALDRATADLAAAHDRERAVALSRAATAVELERARADAAAHVAARDALERQVVEARLAMLTAQLDAEAAAAERRRVQDAMNAMSNECDKGADEHKLLELRVADLAEDLKLARDEAEFLRIHRGALSEELAASLRDRAALADRQRVAAHQAKEARRKFERAAPFVAKYTAASAELKNAHELIHAMQDAIAARKTAHASDLAVRDAEIASLNEQVLSAEDDLKVALEETTRIYTQAKEFEMALERLTDDTAAIHAHYQSREATLQQSLSHAQATLDSLQLSSRDKEGSVRARESQLAHQVTDLQKDKFELQSRLGDVESAAAKVELERDGLFLKLQLAQHELDHAREQNKVDRRRATLAPRPALLDEKFGAVCGGAAAAATMPHMADDGTCAVGERTISVAALDRARTDWAERESELVQHADRLEQALEHTKHSLLLAQNETATSKARAADLASKLSESRMAALQLSAQVQEHEQTLMEANNDIVHLTSRAATLEAGAKSQDARLQKELDKLMADLTASRERAAKAEESLYAAERQLMQAEARATTESNEAARRAEHAAIVEAQLRDDLTRAKRDLSQVRDELRDARRQGENIRVDADAMTRKLQAQVSDLEARLVATSAGAYAAAIAPPSSSALPPLISPGELAQLRTDLAAALAELEDLRSQAAEAATLRGQLETATKQRQRLDRQMRELRDQLAAAHASSGDSNVPGLATLRASLDKANARAFELADELAVSEARSKKLELELERTRARLKSASTAASTAAAVAGADARLAEEHRLLQLEHKATVDMLGEELEKVKAMRNDHRREIARLEAAHVTSLQTAMSRPASASSSPRVRAQTTATTAAALVVAAPAAPAAAPVAASSTTQAAAKRGRQRSAPDQSHVPNGIVSAPPAPEPAPAAAPKRKPAAKRAAKTAVTADESVAAAPAPSTSRPARRAAAVPVNYNEDEDAAPATTAAVTRNLGHVPEPRSTWVMPTEPETPLHTMTGRRRPDASGNDSDSAESDAEKEEKDELEGDATAAIEEPPVSQRGGAARGRARGRGRGRGRGGRAATAAVGPVASSATAATNGRGAASPSADSDSEETAGEKAPVARKGGKAAKAVTAPARAKAAAKQMAPPPPPPRPVSDDESNVEDKGVENAPTRKRRAAAVRTAANGATSTAAAAAAASDTDDNPAQAKLAPPAKRARVPAATAAAAKAAVRPAGLTAPPRPGIEFDMPDLAEFQQQASPLQRIKGGKSTAAAGQGSDSGSTSTSDSRGRRIIGKPKAMIVMPATPATPAMNQMLQRLDRAGADLAKPYAAALRD